jgi:hypothetical protein
MVILALVMLDFPETDLTVPTMTNAQTAKITAQPTQTVKTSPVALNAFANQVRYKNEPLKRS